MKCRLLLASLGMSVFLISCQVHVPDNISLTGGGGSGTPANNTGGGGGGGGNNNGGGSPPNDPIPPKTVEFVIQPGTGANSWNTSSAYVEVNVGDTIRIRNMDSVTHELHMPGNSACPHGSAAIPTGGFYDCVTKKAFMTSATSPQSYDHLRGPASAFFFKAIVP